MTQAMFLFFCCCQWIFTQAKDNSGREFILAFPSNRLLIEYPVGRILITSRARASLDVTIEIPLMPSFMPVTHTLNPGEHAYHDVPYEYHLADTGTELKGILVQATDDVVVQAANINDKSTDAFLVLPTHALGLEYYAMSYLFLGQSAQPQGPSQLAVVGLVDKTEVQIVLPSHVGAVGRIPGALVDGRNVRISLYWCDAFQLQHFGDLTGTRILASQPVAVFSGAKWTSVGRVQMGDHLIEQMLPTHTWGLEFVITPIVTRESGDIIRVLALQDVTTLNYQYSDEYDAPQQSTAYINQSEYFDIDTGLYNGSALYLRSTRQVLVAQMCKSYSVDNNRRSDPFMTIVPPVSHYTPAIQLSTFSGLFFDAYNQYLALAFPGFAKDSFQINGAVVDTTSVVYLSEHLFSTRYTIMVVSLPGDTDVYAVTNSETDFGAVLYGLKFQESYGLLAGQSLDALSGICVTSVMTWGDRLDNDCDGVADEEIFNNLDDDGDSLIDEDVWDDKEANPSEAVVSTNRPTTPALTTRPTTVTTTTVTTPTGITTTATTTMAPTTQQTEDSVETTTEYPLTTPDLEQPTTRDAQLPSTVASVVQSMKAPSQQTTMTTERPTTSTTTSTEPAFITEEQTETSMTMVQNITDHANETYNQTSEYGNQDQNLYTFNSTYLESNTTENLTFWNTSSVENTSENPTTVLFLNETWSDSAPDSTLPDSTTHMEESSSSAEVVAESTNFFLDNLLQFAIAISLLLGLPLICLVYCCVGSLIASKRAKRRIDVEHDLSRTMRKPASKKHKYATNAAPQCVDMRNQANSWDDSHQQNIANHLLKKQRK